MRKKVVLGLLLVVLGIGGSVVFLQHSGGAKQETHFTVEVLARGDIENTVSSTGTLSAVGTVEVGSQISGTVEQVLVDYNDQVSKGQLLAVVDTSLLEASVRDAKASVAKFQAQYNQAHAEHKRNNTLFQQGFISEMALLTYSTSVKTAYASLVSAKEALKRAQTNLNYANICSPIDGTIIERSIDAGQTIAASLNAPTLFTIAEDLAQMQIEASVDESDIGQIRKDMPVRFTVQAYPDDEFTGTVRQIRLQPTTIQDVVNYTVIVDAPNSRRLLLPGMTATIDFLIEERRNVLLVPNTALYVQPPQELMQSLRQQFQAGAPGERPGQQGQKRGNGTGARPAPNGLPFSGEQGRMGPMGTPRSNGAQKRSRVFYLNENGEPRIARFVAGASDGAMTEVMQSVELTEGTRVITSINSSQKASKNQNGFSLPIPGMGPGPRR